MGQIVDGRFELRSLVASGGMGSIYQAHDLATGQLVAVKLISAPGSGLPRFVVESRILSELEHPSIVRYVAHGVSAEGAPYLAMEWLDGEDLSRHLARNGARPVAEVLAWIRQAAEGLAVAHRRGVVHRDIKPSNVFLV
ncbi:MAG TPA: serine/threonine-protein kinase, partial [Polyangiaceae bacterium]